MATTPSFVVGKTYARRKDIHEAFGGGHQSGISPSASTPAIFVFTGQTGKKYGYPDRRDASGVFLYSGEGQVGDMTFKSGNKALRDHAREGRAVHLFTALGKGKAVRYEGEHCVANYSIATGPDRDGRDRKIIVFHLLPVDQADQDTSQTAAAVADRMQLDLAAARARALAAAAAGPGEAGSSARRTVYERAEAVRAYVLLREGGSCRGCEQPAPFNRLDGSPYLESHHTHRRSDGGLDHPRYVAAICPTCHARIHRGEGGKELNLKLIRWLEANEPLK